MLQTSKLGFIRLQMFITYYDQPSLMEALTKIQTCEKKTVLFYFFAVSSSEKLINWLLSLSHNFAKICDYSVNRYIKQYIVVCYTRDSVRDVRKP